MVERAQLKTDSIRQLGVCSVAQMNHKVVGILGGSKPFFYIFPLGIANLTRNRISDPSSPSFALMMTNYQ